MEGGGLLQEGVRPSCAKVSEQFSQTYISAFTGLCGRHDTRELYLVLTPAAGRTCFGDWWAKLDWDIPTRVPRYWTDLSDSKVH